jgi:hypothetical protein
MSVAHDLLHAPLIPLAITSGNIKQQKGLACQTTPD